MNIQKAKEVLEILNNIIKNPQRDFQDRYELNQDIEKIRSIILSSIDEFAEKEEILKYTFGCKEES